MGVCKQFDHRSHRGSILLVVLVVVALMTIGGMTYFNWTFTEHRATRMYGRQRQALAAAESGAAFLRIYLAEDAASIEQDGGLYDNPNRFRGLLMQESDAAALRLRISMLSPNIDRGVYDGVRYGLENESSRLNLNTLLLADDYAENGARNLLLGLPGMTESIADAILDWLDEDEEPRDYGAELSHYSAQTPAYEPQNGPLESIDQLLMVRDVTETLLYGLDKNRNFVVDANEALVALPDTVDNTDGAMNRGWAAYLTLYSAESNLNAEGEAKIDVNQEDLEELHQQLESALGRDEANFIVAFRQGGPKEEGEGDGPAKLPGQIQIDFTTPGSEKIDSLLSLVGVNTSTTEEGSPNEQFVKTPFPDDPSQMQTYLPLLMDNLTVNSDPVVPGRINVNQAPRVLLGSLPGMPPESVESIIAARDFEVDSARPERAHATWLLAEGYVTLEEMKQLDPFLCGGGNVFRAQIAGYYEAEGPVARLEVVVDASNGIPKVLHKLDLTPLGAGFGPEILGVELATETPPKP